MAVEVVEEALLLVPVGLLFIIKALGVAVQVDIIKTSTLFSLILILYKSMSDEVELAVRV